MFRKEFLSEQKAQEFQLWAIEQGFNTNFFRYATICLIFVVECW